MLSLRASCALAQYDSFCSVRLQWTPSVNDDQLSLCWPCHPTKGSMYALVTTCDPDLHPQVFLSAMLGIPRASLHFQQPKISYLRLRRRGPPLTPRGSWSARMCGGLGWGNGGKHEQRRISEYPHFHLVHVCRPSLPSRPTTCACDSLSLAYMATRTAMYCRRSCRTYRPLAQRQRSNASGTFLIPSRSRVHDPAPRLSFRHVCSDSGLWPSWCSSCLRAIVRPSLRPGRSW